MMLLFGFDKMYSVHRQFIRVQSNKTHSVKWKQTRQQVSKAGGFLFIDGVVNLPLAWDADGWECCFFDLSV